MSRIALTILGTTAGVPTKERAHSAVYISYDDGDETCILLDCGEGTQRQIMKTGLGMMKLDNIFITHWHGDHCLGLPGLLDTMGFEGRKKPVTVFAPEVRRVKKCLGFGYSIGGYKINTKLVPHKGSKIKILFETERFYIESVPVEHGIPSVAYALVEKDKKVLDPVKVEEAGLPPEGLMYGELKEKGSIEFEGRTIFLKDLVRTEKGKRVVYSGDTIVCDNLRKIVRGADLLVQDCTYFGEIGPTRSYMHASFPEVVEMSKSEGVGRTILTHISRKFQDTDQLKNMVKDDPSMGVAEDFMRVEI